MKVLVCGGRDFANKITLDYILDMFNKETQIDTIIHGDARGADSLASLWAREHNIKEIPFPADWEKYGKAAGPIRNEQMLDYSKPDMVIAFPGGNGTKHMIDLATRKGYDVKVIHLHEVVNDEK